MSTQHRTHWCEWLRSAAFKPSTPCEYSEYTVVQTVKDAGTAQHGIPMAGAARAWWLHYALCATAATVLLTICEGGTIATSRPTGANFM